MPWDPTPVSADPLDAEGRRETLTVQLQGAGDEPETLLVLGRPADGVVAVREHPALGPVTTYEAAPAAVAERIERVRRAGRRVGVEALLLRELLAGRA
jgi:hypothetical protein